MNDFYLPDFKLNVQIQKYNLSRFISGNGTVNLFPYEKVCIMKLENSIYHFNFVGNDRLSTIMPCDGSITTHYELIEFSLEDAAFGGGIFSCIKETATVQHEGRKK